MIPKQGTGHYYIPEIKSIIGNTRHFFWREETTFSSNLPNVHDSKRSKATLVVHLYPFSDEVSEIQTNEMSYTKSCR